MNLSYIPVILLIGLIYVFFLITLCLLKSCRIQTSSTRRQIENALNNPYGLYPPKVETGRLRKFLTLAYLIFRVFYTFLFTASVILSLILSLQYQSSNNLNRFVSSGDHQLRNVYEVGVREDYNLVSPKIESNRYVKRIKQCEEDSAKRREHINTLFVSFSKSVLRHVSNNEDFIQKIGAKPENVGSTGGQHTFENVTKMFNKPAESTDSIEGITWTLIDDETVSGIYNQTWSKSFKKYIESLESLLRPELKWQFEFINRTLPENLWLGPMQRSQSSYQPDSLVMANKATEILGKLLNLGLSYQRSYNLSSKIALAEYFGSPEFSNILFSFSHIEKIFKEKVGRLPSLRKLIAEYSLEKALNSDELKQNLDFFQILYSAESIDTRALSQNMQKVTVDDASLLTEDLLLTSFLRSNRRDQIENRDHQKSFFSDQTQFHISIRHLRMLLLFLDVYLIVSRCVTTYRIVKRLWFGHYRTIRIKRNNFVQTCTFSAEKSQERNKEEDQSSYMENEARNRISLNNYESVQSLKSTNIGFNGYCNQGDIHYVDFIVFLGLMIITLALCMFFQGNKPPDGRWASGNFNFLNATGVFGKDETTKSGLYASGGDNYLSLLDDDQIGLLNNLNKINIKFSLGMENIRDRILHEKHYIVYQQLAEWCSTHTTLIELRKRDTTRIYRDFQSLNNTVKFNYYPGNEKNLVDYYEYCQYPSFESFVFAAKKGEMLSKMMVFNDQNLMMRNYSLANFNDYVYDTFTLSDTHCINNLGKKSKSITKEEYYSKEENKQTEDFYDVLERKKMDSISDDCLRITIVAFIVILSAICFFEVVQILARMMNLRLKKSYPINITLINTQPNQELVHQQIAIYYHRLKQEASSRQEFLQSHPNETGTSEKDRFLSGTMQPLSSTIKNTENIGLSIVEPQFIPISPSNGNYTLSSGFYLNPSSPYNIHSSNLVPMSTYAIQDGAPINTNTLKSLYSGAEGLNFESIENLFGDPSQGNQPVYILPTTTGTLKGHTGQMNLDDQQKLATAFYVTKSP